MANTDVEEIKNRLNIVDVLGEYLKLDKAGANWKATCPFHNEKTPSFMVNEEKQIWHCFGCQKGGDIFSFIMEMEGLEFPSALKMLAQKAGVEMRSFNPQREKEKNRVIEILELATKWYEHQLWSGPGKIKIIKYLHERGLKDESIKEFRLGYAPKGWRNILTFLTKRGYELKEISRTGLLVQKEGSQNFYDRFRERVMFPIADYSGRIVGFSARVSPGGDESQAKYVNTPETEVYHKSKILYGIDKARSEIKQKGSVLLVEGNMDVIAAHQSGLRNTIAVSGTALTREQIGIIKRYAKKINMFFDMDSAGIAATRKSAKLSLAEDLSVNIVSLPQGKDAADVAKENPKDLQKAVENSLEVMEYFSQKAFEKYKKSDADGKRNIAEDMLDIIESFENSVEKSHWIKKLSEDLDVPEAALTDMLKKASLKRVVGGGKLNENKPDNAPALTKLETLEKELIGLMLISNDVWQEVQKEIKKEEVSLKDSLLSSMLKRGAEVNYDFDAFCKKINSDRDLKNKAEKIFFEKKYWLNLDNNPEEIIIENPLDDLNVCLQEIRRELKRKKLAEISADLKMAEKRKDKKAQLFLRQEFNKISKDETPDLNK